MFYVDFLESYAMGESSFRKPTEQIYEIITSEKYDIVHVHNFMPMLLTSIIRPLIKCPVIFTFHNTPNGSERAIGYYQNSKLDIQLAKSVINFQKYNRLVVGSQCYYDFAIKLGADPKLTTLSYLGIDHKEFEKNIRESSKIDLTQYFGNKLKKDDFLITLPGRITQNKGIVEAIEALNIVNKTKRVKLLLTNMVSPFNHELGEFVISKSKEFCINNKIIIPKKIIARHHMAAIYCRSNIVITPSYYEGLGLTAIEALKANRPLVATNVTGLNEIIKNEENSLVIAPKDANSLANAILRLIDNPKLAKKISECGSDSVTKFDIKLHVEKLERIYKEEIWKL